jgi:hypothetical protein
MDKQKIEQLPAEGQPKKRGWEIARSAPLPRQCYSGPRPNHRSPEVPGRKLRSFFSGNARKLADQADRGLPIDPRELLLLVQTVREITAIEAA